MSFAVNSDTALDDFVTKLISKKHITYRGLSQEVCQTRTTCKADVTFQGDYNFDYNFVIIHSLAGV